MLCETICEVHEPPEVAFSKLTFLPPLSLAKPLLCRLLDMFHKEKKCFN